MMSAILWAGCGLAGASAVVFTAFGLTRPVEWKHLAFAGAMFFLACYFSLQQAFYSSDSLQLKIEIVRWQLNVAILYQAVFAVFLSLYSGWRPRPLVAIGACLYLFMLLVSNWLLPYTIYFQNPPEMASIKPFGADSIHLLDAPLNGYVFALFSFFVLSNSWGAYQIYRRRPGRWLVFTALLICLLSVGLDFVRDAVGGSWPYSVEFSTALLALLMSIDLAIECRAKSAHLARALNTTIHIRDQLNTPLQTLTLGLDLLPATTPEHKDLILRLKNSVDRLEHLGRDLHKNKLLK